MSTTKTVKIMRRDFLASSSLLFLTAGCLKAFPLPSQTAPRGSDLTEELSPVELEIVRQSIMARDLENFWGKGYS
jgi:hypothetical protein